MGYVPPPHVPLDRFPPSTRQRIYEAQRRELLAGLRYNQARALCAAALLLVLLIAFAIGFTVSRATRNAVFSHDDDAASHPR